MTEKTSKQTLPNAGILNGLLDAGVPPGIVARKFNVTVQELEQLTKDLLPTKHAVEEYREVQHLKLTQIQSKLLDAMCDENKIESASLSELARVFSILKEKELLMNGKATQITGLVGYLVELEKEYSTGGHGSTVVEVNPVKKNVQDAVVVQSPVEDLDFSFGTGDLEHEEVLPTL